MTAATDGTIRDAGLSDPVGEGALQHPVEQVPGAALSYLLPSRYCETDILSEFAWARVG